jgi:TonB family protein
VKIVCHSANVTPFSFFSWVVVNPSLTETETREIMNHEMVHVRQRHWLDLLLTGLLCTLQWFNPVVWIYARFIRQNHEYLADEEALRTTSDPVLYRAALLNQIAGAPVIDLCNSFGYSLNKKRFYMMKNIVTSPARKLRLLLILPVSVMILYAFAEPEYRIVTSDEVIFGAQIGSAGQARTAKGIVVGEDGNPLQGAAVVLKGTTIGTLSDQQGRFSLDKVPSDGLLVISFVGFETKVVNPVFGYDMIVKMLRANFVTDTVEIAPPPPPPPPVPSGEEEPLYIVDGVITDSDLLEITPENVESINVLKGESATSKYGDKGKNGVILITMKKTSPELISAGNPEQPQGKQGEDEKYVIIEEMPQFPGGEEAMMSWIVNNVRYPSEAIAQKISGLVYVSFTVGATGKVSNVKIDKSVHPLLDAEALRVIGSMPYWKPGRQHGRPVDVGFSVPVEFKLDGSKIMKVQKTK